MRTIGQLVAAVVLILIFSSCSKEESNPVVTGLEAGTVRYRGVYAIDEGSTLRYMYQSTAITVMRQRVEKTYPLSELAKERTCVLEAQFRKAYAGIWLLRFDGEEHGYVSVAPTFSVSGQEELALYIDDDVPDMDDIEYEFRIHEFDPIEGRRVLAIESVKYPGHYITNFGHTLSGNGVIVRKHDSKEAADKWQVFSL